MKKNRILVGIDYSKSSENALQYALMLARKTPTKIILLHVFEFPIIHTNSGLYTMDYKAMKENDLARLSKVKEQALKKFPKAEIELLNTTDSIKSFVKDLASKKKIDYVVLGLETKSKISKFIYGTTGVNLSTRIDCPVIIVPESYKIHKLDKTVISVDNKETIKKRTADKAIGFTEQHGASHQMLYIKTEDDFLLIYEKNPKKQNKKWDIKTLEAKDFESGINKYMISNPTDMIVLFSKSYSALYRFFNETNTKVIAFQSKVPVMSIHK